MKKQKQKTKNKKEKVKTKVVWDYGLTGSKAASVHDQTKNEDHPGDRAREK